MQLLLLVWRQYRWPFVAVMALSLASAALGIGLIAFINVRLIEMVDTSLSVLPEFLGLLLQGGGILRAHQKVRTPQGEGEITSGSFSPTLQQSIALARLPLGIAPGAEVDVDIRGKQLKAKVVKPGFVRHGKALV